MPDEREREKERKTQEPTTVSLQQNQRLISLFQEQVANGHHRVSERSAAARDRTRFKLLSPMILSCLFNHGKSRQAATTARRAASSCCWINCRACRARSSPSSQRSRQTARAEQKSVDITADEKLSNAIGPL